MLFNKIKKIIDISNPKLLRNILLFAFSVHFVSVLFAKGFGMHDDHFLVIEAAQSWADGTDYNDWLPSSGAIQPSGHSFFYSGIHFIFFSFFKFIHLNDPQLKMYIIRLLHALFSLLIVNYGYKIALRLSNTKVARFTGILLALYWFMPFLSVRNLVETACIPFLMWGSWVYIKAISDKEKLIKFFYSGIIFGLCFSIRFQMFFFIAGFGIGMLILKQWKAMIFWGAGLIMSFTLIQGVIDYSIWGYPFAEFAEYIRYNIYNAYNYINNPWYSYLLLILGILVPPLCFFLFFGFVRSYKIQLALFLGTMIFFIFHSYFPNKQERFIFPIVPMIIVLGSIGWYDFADKSKFWIKNKKLLTYCIGFFWIINLATLPFISTMYSKKARVESMCYLSKYSGIKTILLEDIFHGTPQMPPEYYLGQWISTYDVSKDSPQDSIKMKIDRWGYDTYPRFILFFDDKGIDERVRKIEEITPNIEYETTIKPGFIDDLLFRMNPKNANQTIVIYRNKDFYPKKIE